MMTGTVVRWVADRGFGFIRVDGSDEDVFVHITAGQDAGIDLVKDLRVKFLVDVSKDGRQRAVDLRLA